LDQEQPAHENQLQPAKKKPHQPADQLNHQASQKKACRTLPFFQNKSAISNHLAVLFSLNESARANSQTSGTLARANSQTSGTLETLKQPF
jgi:superoxide dismutase